MPPAPTAPRTRAAHLGPERRRPQVLDAARDIALGDGLGAVNVRTVAEHLGVTRPVVYACFADRVEMVEALLDREAAVLTGSLLEALHSTGVQTDPEQAFVSGFQALLGAVEDNPAPWRLLFAGEPDPAVSERFREARARVQHEATAWIGPAMRAWWGTSDLDRKLPVLIELFMSACESAMRTVLGSAGQWTADDLGAFMGRAVYRALKDA